MARYDRAITVFSPDGHLFQVEYALEAVKKGTLAIGVKGRDAVVLGVEKKSTAQLQDARTVRKILMLDDHIVLTFAGLTADARVLINKARIEAQSFRLTLDEKMDIENMTKYIAGIQQRYTQSGGRRPFGISTLLAGFDPSGRPCLFQTDPSGNYAEWKAVAIGRNSKTTREFLEKNYEESEGEGTIKLVVKTLMETLEASGKTVEVAIVGREGKLQMLPEEEVDRFVKMIEEEKAAAEAAKKRGGSSAAQGGAS
ncbi:unnamed protein product [Pedinophyceae sp. YPF-701]|nr:unnamed protein product [Pedinophyceae sp. YPF-701]